MADAIFISYRRDDSEGEAGRLFDDLTRAFGNDAVFMDVAGIKPGLDFREVIESNVAVCAVFLAIIGPSWATIKNAEGVRRLDDPKDFVALELGSALRRNVPVIPVLVHDATMPAADLLPEQLKDFSYRNSVELSHARWSSDIKLLIEALKPYVVPAKNAGQQPIHATVPVQLPPPRPSTLPMPVLAKKSKMPVILAICVTLLVVLVLLGVIGVISDKEEDKKKGANAALAPSSQQQDSTTSQPQPVPQPNVQPSVQPSAQQAPPIAHATQNPPSVVPSPHPGFVGSWTSPVPRVGNSLQRLVVTASGDTLFMHPYGNCQSPECDWGEQPVIFEGAAATSVFHISPFIEADGSTTLRVVQVVATTAHGHLNLDLRNQYQNSKVGSLSKTFQVTLVPQN